MTPDQASAIEERIGARILIARTRQKITAKDLAAKAGIHRNTIYRLESGICKCELANLYRIAIALNLKISDLLP